MCYKLITEPFTGQRSGVLLDLPGIVVWICNYLLGSCIRTLDSQFVVLFGKVVTLEEGFVVV